MTFEDLSFDSTITAAIRSAGYTSPTPIQQKAVPIVIEGCDSPGIAHTGTGKTAAFVLRIFLRLNKRSSCRPRVQIIVPTREFAEQIQQKGQHNGNQETIFPQTTKGTKTHSTGAGKARSAPRTQGVEDTGHAGTPASACADE